MLDTAALRRGRILQLAWPARFETSGDPTLRCRATRGRGARAAAALRCGLAASGRRRVTAPVGAGVAAPALAGAPA